MNILFSTRTNWNEPPRIRHQYALLLISMGHDIMFVEKPVPLWKKKLRIQSPQPGLTTVQVRELIHPQLRAFSWLSKIDQNFRRRQLKQLVAEENIDLHISFFLDSHSVLPQIPRIQIINDDFVGAATWISRKVTKLDFKHSVRFAHKTLTVSYPLNKQVAKDGGDPDLFLPWAPNSAICSIDASKRNSILYFGYLANRIRWEIIELFVSNDIQIDFYAPISSAKANDLKWLKHLQQFPAFHLKKETSLHDLDPSKYICSIQPYVPTNHYNQMITFSNRTVRLLWLGIPCLHEDLPHLISCDRGVIFRAHTPTQYMNGFQFLKRNRSKSLELISTFLSSHDLNARKLQLNKVLNEIFEEGL